MLKKETKANKKNTWGKKIKSTKIILKKTKQKKYVKNDNFEKKRKTNKKIKKKTCWES